MKINYLKYVEINPVKWDKCINTSFNGVIYAYSWYLNIVCDEWDALVLDDYKAVMPLTHKKKFGLNYLLQPFFTQQLGVFSTEKLSSSLVEEFLKRIPRKYLYIEINLNIFNKLKPIQGLKYDYYPTHQLDLINSYELIHKSYSTNTQRNLKEARAKKISIINSLTINEFIDFVRQNLKSKIKLFSEREYDTLRMLCSMLLRNKAGELFAAYTDQNELCAVSLFAYAHNKSIYLMGASSAEGFENKAMFLLIDYYIQKNSEHNSTLDFEGSRIEGIARFYKGFGAREVNYPVVKRNKFPFFFNLARKIRAKLKQ